MVEESTEPREAWFDGQPGKIDLLVSIFSYFCFCLHFLLLSFIIMPLIPSLSVFFDIHLEAKGQSFEESEPSLLESGRGKD